MSNNVRYINDYKSVKLPDGTSVFENGCFNCVHLAEKYSTVSGRCVFISNLDYKVWKDFTCNMHVPIVSSSTQITDNQSKNI